MSLIDLLIENKLSEARDYINNQLNLIAYTKLEEYKRYVAEDTYIEEKVNNVVKMGRIKKIRKKISRNAQGRIIIRRNVLRSTIKGYTVSGNGLKRIPQAQRIAKARSLKRYWKTKGKAKMSRMIIKRKISMRRRKAMGL